ncbi:hypothetical protein [Gracilimonas sp.]|uniref:hypothetical protein n=1 Tax=Gracilimonas sp. TaxID=1974203 RepID=UPI003BAC9ABC
MKIKPFLSIPTLFLLIFAHGPAASQSVTSYPLWNEIESGEYSVGFKVINHWDKSRNRYSKYEKSGKLNEARFFPIQISIWYPAAERWDPVKAMPFKTYFYLTEQKNDFNSLSEERKEKALDIFFNFATLGAGLELTKENVLNIGNMATAAMQDVEAVNKKFSVIIAGHDGGVWKGTTLHEFLASHGYVVISTGPVSQTFSIFSEHPQVAIQRRIRTFELVREMTTQFDFIDDSKIGLLGLNSDGMPAMLYQMKNGEADALVNIDGWEGKNNGYEYVSSNSYYDNEKFQIPYLEFQQHENTNRESLQLNSTIFENLKSNSKQSYVLTEFGHAYLTGNLIAVPGLKNKEVEKYQFMFDAILAFYTHYLKGQENLYTKSDKPDSFFERAKIISEE